MYIKRLITAAFGSCKRFHNVYRGLMGMSVPSLHSLPVVLLYACACLYVSMLSGCDVISWLVYNVMA